LSKDLALHSMTQSVYDEAKDKIGTVDDVIIGDNGQVT
jgi:hypothetical protein